MSRTPRTQAAILDLLAHKHALSALEIAEQLKVDGEAVNKTTVYRAVEKLLEQGILCSQVLEGTTAVYELRGDHHDHLICEKCGRVSVIECLVRLPNDVDGFHVGHHHLSVYGICKLCTS